MVSQLLLLLFVVWIAPVLRRKPLTISLTVVISTLSETGLLMVPFSIVQSSSDSDETLHIFSFSQEL